MLEHAHRNDAVEMSVDVAIVLQAEIDAVGETGFAARARRDRELFLRQSDADGARADDCAR